MRLLLLIKKTEYCYAVRDTILKDIPDCIVVEGDSGDSFPAIEGAFDYIISFLSPWILPKEVLDRSKVSLNFHPAPPEYPGTGCYNFALYDQVTEYGATCHHMLPKVDTGAIVAVKRFSMDGIHSVLALKNRTMEALIALFEELWSDIASGKDLPHSSEAWTRKPYKRSDLQALCELTPDMDEQELSLRIRATYFPGAADLPYLLLNGKRFVIDEAPSELGGDAR